MPGELQPLVNNQKIANERGEPTEYFIRWAQQRQIDISEGISHDEAIALIQAWAADRQIIAGNVLSGGGSLDHDVTIDHETSLVTPGSYTNADITVDAFGHVTAAADGSGGGGGQTAFRYWAIVCFGSYLNAFCAVEIQMRAIAGGPNIATGGTPFANFSEFGAAANAFDGNLGTFWGTATTPGRYIGYDFGADVTIQQIAWTARTAAEAAQTPYWFEVCGSPDKLVWKTMWSGTFAAFTSGGTQLSTKTFDP